MTHQNNTPAGDPPYADGRAEDFREGGEAVYVLVGEITGADTAAPGLILGPGRTRRLPAKLVPALTFLRTARLEHQVLEWARWAGVSQFFMARLLMQGYIVRINANGVQAAAQSLKGLRIVPTGGSMRGETQSNGYVELKSREGDGSWWLVSPPLDALLWENTPGEDIPTAVRRMGQVFDADQTLLLNNVFGSMPQLIDHGMARLEHTGRKWF